MNVFHHISEKYTFPFTDTVRKTHSKSADILILLMNCWKFLKKIPKIFVLDFFKKCNRK